MCILYMSISLYLSPCNLSLYSTDTTPSKLGTTIDHDEEKGELGTYAEEFLLGGYRLWVSKYRLSHPEEWKGLIVAKGFSRKHVHILNIAGVQLLQSERFTTTIPHESITFTSSHFEDNEANRSQLMAAHRFERFRRIHLNDETLSPGSDVTSPRVISSVPVMELARRHGEFTH